MIQVKNNECFSPIFEIFFFSDTISSDYVLSNLIDFASSIWKALCSMNWVGNKCPVINLLNRFSEIHKTGKNVLWKTLF